MANAMLRPFFEAYAIVADVLCSAPADIDDKELTSQALGVGAQYAAQGLPWVSSNESVSALLFATGRQVAADQKLMGASQDLRERRTAFLHELREIIDDMDRIHQLSREQFYAREAQLGFPARESATPIK